MCALFETSSITDDDNLEDPKTVLDSKQADVLESKGTCYVPKSSYQLSHFP